MPQSLLQFVTRLKTTRSILIPSRSRTETQTPTATTVVDPAWRRRECHRRPTDRHACRSSVCRRSNEPETASGAVSRADVDVDADGAGSAAEQVQEKQKTKKRRFVRSANDRLRNNKYAMFHLPRTSSGEAPPHATGTISRTCCRKRSGSSLGEAFLSRSWPWKQQHRKDTRPRPGRLRRRRRCLRLRVSAVKSTDRSLPSRLSSTASQSPAALRESNKLPAPARDGAHRWIGTGRAVIVAPAGTAAPVAAARR